MRFIHSTNRGSGVATKLRDVPWSDSLFKLLGATGNNSLEQTQRMHGNIEVVSLFTQRHSKDHVIFFENHKLYSIHLWQSTIQKLKSTIFLFKTHYLLNLEHVLVPLSLMMLWSNQNINLVHICIWDLAPSAARWESGKQRTRLGLTQRYGISCRIKSCIYG